jgi:signal transduction histidine kinase
MNKMWESLKRQQSATHPDRQISAAERLILRVVWLLFTIGLLILLPSNLAADYSHAQIPCRGSTCDVGQVAVGNVIALRRLGIPVSVYTLYPFLFSLVVTAILFLLSFLLFWRRSDQWFAGFVSLWLLVAAAVNVISPYATLLPVPVRGLVADGLVIALFLGLGLFAVTYPNGRFDPRWSWIIPLLWILQLLAFLAPPPLNIAAWPGPFMALVVALVYGGTLALQVLRYVTRYNAVEREQVKWFVFGLAISVAYVIGYSLLMAALPSDSPALLLLLPVPLVAACGTSLSVGAALLRYRLFDIDIFISRTLVYATLTAIVAGIYIVIVGYLGSLFDLQSSLFASLLATGVIAVLFQPLRSRLQQTVNRLLFGARDEPYRVLARLDQRLAAAMPPEEVLPAMVTAIATTLNLPYVAIELVEGIAKKSTERLLVSYGSSTEVLESLPMLYQGDAAGHLLVAPRAGESHLSPLDRRLLSDLARHAGVVAHSVRLTGDLRRSRERIVLAREEERRRLRRDLHDGLGPMLASLTLTLAGAREYLSSDPATADKLFQTLATHVQEAVSDIRRLVYELRPPALDDLGLVGALRDQATRLAPKGLEVEIEASAGIDPLPAAVEVAAYRIGVEALTNVVRHAQATSCKLQVRRNRDLVIEIRDDGRGLPPSEIPLGIGLHSMRERAEELGGSCLVTAQPEGGTVVIAHLPLTEEGPRNYGTDHESTNRYPDRR